MMVAWHLSPGDSLGGCRLLYSNHTLSPWREFPTDAVRVQDHNCVHALAKCWMYQVVISSSIAFPSFSGYYQALCSPNLDGALCFMWTAAMAQELLDQLPQTPESAWRMKTNVDKREEQVRDKNTKPHTSGILLPKAGWEILWEGHDRAEPVTIWHSVCKMVSGTFQNEYSHATKRINKLNVRGAKGWGVHGFC